jgi:hypothetical protein
MFRNFQNKISAFWNPQPKANVPEAVKKEDSFIVPHYIETRLSKPSCQDHSSHVVLQKGFCCEKPNTKLVATNHTTQLFDCCKDKCSRKLIKVKIGEWN